MTIICCICPRGCGTGQLRSPVRSAQSSWQLPWTDDQVGSKLSCSRCCCCCCCCCCFQHNLYKVSQFLALCICCWQTAHLPAPRKAATVCTLPMQKSNINFVILSQVVCMRYRCTERNILLISKITYLYKN